MKTFSSVVIASLSMVGLVSAQPAKAPAPAAAGAPALKDAKPVAAEPPKPAGPPTPPAEVAAAVKAIGGNWKCTGQGMDMASPTMIPMTGTMKAKADLDGWWMADTFEAKMGKVKLKISGYSTYDPPSKKWRRVAVDNMGGQMIGTSDGLKENKMTYNLDTMGGGMPPGMFRDHTEVVDAKNTKMWGEMSMDKGKTWTKVYEAACKK